MVTDEELASQVQAGDVDAFGELMHRYHPKLARYARTFLYSYDDREDALQDVFIKTYQNIQSFNTRERFSPWIYRIAHNTFLNVIRTQKREKITYFDSDTLFAREIPDTNELHAREHALDKEELEHHLAKLDVKYREALVLFYFEEKSYDEIAEILRIPKATVGVRLARARQQLATHYQS